MVRGRRKIWRSFVDFEVWLLKKVDGLCQRGFCQGTCCGCIGFDCSPGRFRRSTMGGGRRSHVEILGSMRSTDAIRCEIGKVQQRMRIKLENMIFACILEIQQQAPSQGLTARRRRPKPARQESESHATTDYPAFVEATVMPATQLLNEFDFASSTSTDAAGEEKTRG